MNDKLKEIELYLKCEERMENKILDRPDFLNLPAPPGFESWLKGRLDLIQTIREMIKEE